MGYVFDTVCQWVLRIAMVIACIFLCIYVASPFWETKTVIEDQRVLILETGKLRDSSSAFDSHFTDLEYSQDGELPICISVTDDTAYLLARDREGEIITVDLIKKEGWLLVSYVHWDIDKQDLIAVLQEAG